MIYLATECINMQIISIAISAEVGRVSGLLVDPFRFSVAGFWVASRKPVIVLSKSVRQIEDTRLFINSEDDLNAPKDLPRLRNVFKYDYQIPGKKVISTEQEYLGRAENFSFDEYDCKIAQIIARPPLLKRLTNRRLHFTRNQIEHVKSKTIEVRVGLQTESMQRPALNPNQSK